jgi:hypothetical protein
MLEHNRRRKRFERTTNHDRLRIHDELEACGRLDQDNVAEWLRRWIANPLLFERESSNLSVVVCVFYTSKVREEEIIVWLG